MLTIALATAGLGPFARGAEGQSRPEPQLLLSIAAGVSSGTTLYTNLHQPVVLIEDVMLTDTMALGRRVSPGILLGAGATYFPHPNLGLTAEASFVGFGRDDACAMVYRAPSSLEGTSNEQICADITAMSGTASTMAFELGGLYRVASRGAVKPYLRGQAGITTRSASTVEVAGRFLDGNGVTRTRAIIVDTDPGSVDPTATFALGVMIPVGAGYQARLEVRDKLLVFERVTGPATTLGEATTESYLGHSIGLVFTLDIVLEQRRGRRY
jgi:hypothetical protein